MAKPNFSGLMRRCVDTFGVKAWYLRDDRKTAVEGVFDDDFEMVGFDDNGRVTSRTISFSMHRDAIPFSPKRGDRLRVGKTEYRIDHHEPDSEFGMVLILKKA